MTGSAAAASSARPGHANLLAVPPRRVTSARCSKMAQMSTEGPKTEPRCSEATNTSTKGSKTEPRYSKVAKSSTDISIEGTKRTKQSKNKIKNSDTESTSLDQ